MPTNSSKPTSSDNTDRDPETTINVCLHRDTHTRLTAYKNDNPLIEKSYDEAINEILPEHRHVDGLADAFEGPRTSS